MASRVTGAIFRAFIVAALVLAPSMLVPGLSVDAQQTVALVALFAAALTYVEYNADAPGLVEFRDAPPFNRTRFALLAVTVFALTLIERGRDLPSTLTDLITAVGMLIGQAMDFPYSPVRLATEALADTASATEIAALRTAAGTAYLTTLLALFVFSFLMRRTWPRPGRTFNVWVNLPTFDPTSVSDIVARLERDARINISLGFLLPFLLPAVAHLTMGGLDPAVVTAPHTLIWITAAWAFFPASLFMRGIAMLRLAQMIREKRRANSALAEAGAQLA
ncbi:hypothetical protein [Fuscovulum ytuae]|uniref:Uncharacterized protein n=1 Tax=Fuscovulum ytuae TaxID=3042299 RepID=A0ABY8Q3L3_9RHOB|nr:hypothetical protein [Fuscovulum sp. YMD61]WGV14792.1 hypothetical protein QF092_10850 [Fuscovulum sp. YMD61]